MTAAQINYTNLENIIRNNPRVRALVDANKADTAPLALSERQAATSLHQPAASFSGDTPVVQRASRRRAAGANTSTAHKLPVANTTATATHRL